MKMSKRVEIAYHEMGHAVMLDHIGRQVLEVRISRRLCGLRGSCKSMANFTHPEKICREVNVQRANIKVHYAGKLAEQVYLGVESKGSYTDMDTAKREIKEYLRTKPKVSESACVLLEEELQQEVIQFLNQPKIREKVEEGVQRLLKEGVIYGYDSRKEEVNGDGERQ